MLTRGPEQNDGAAMPSQTANAAPEDTGARLARATHGLAQTHPEFSAAVRITRPQASLGIGGTLGAAWLGWGAPELVGGFVFAFTGLLFFAVLIQRSAALAHFFCKSQKRVLQAVHHGTRIDDDQLPVYTILVPLFREAALVDDILASLQRLDYPLDKLDIILALEACDSETIAAVARHEISAPARGQHRARVIVPAGLPQTKPRALNYAMTFARGDYVVVFDAEDAPEPDQLRNALAVFAADAAQNNGDCIAAHRPLGCVQAQLNTRNPDATWLTRQFTLEYSALFDAVLPLLQRLDLPMPLGGTSNHFVRRHLEAVGGWDPYNVTEDADLGVRLARLGFRCAVVTSTTWEEAPAKWPDWFGQRTRWLKGWLQTYLVHMREPCRLARELGAFRFAGFHVLLGGMLVSAYVHPWFYILFGWAVATGTVPQLFAATFESFAFTFGLVMLGLSYLVIVALGIAATAARGRGRLAGSALSAPIYWLAISAAAYAALWQFVWRPFYWAKTQHSPRAPTEPLCQTRDASDKIAPPVP